MIRVWWSVQMCSWWGHDWRRDRDGFGAWTDYEHCSRHGCKAGRRNPMRVTLTRGVGAGLGEGDVEDRKASTNRCWTMLKNSGTAAPEDD